MNRSPKAILKSFNLCDYSRPALEPTTTMSLGRAELNHRLGRFTPTMGKTAVAWLNGEVARALGLTCSAVCNSSTALNTLAKLDRFVSEGCETSPPPTSGRDFADRMQMSVDRALGSGTERR